MTQNNLYMEDENLRLYVDVQPLFLDELENSKNIAVECAQSANQSAQNAQTWLDSIISYKTNIELFYAQVVSDITIRLQNAISAIVDAKDAAIASLQQVLTSMQTTGQNIINQLNNASAQAIEAIDNNVSTDYLIQSHAIESGAVSNKNNVLGYIKSYAHSTFCGYQASNASPLDPKKFIKVGSPVITNDGIASGFSSSNYIKFPFPDVTSKNYRIDFYTNYKHAPSGTRQDVMGCLSNSPKRMLFAITSGGAGALFLSSDGTTWNITNPKSSSFTLTNNKNYKFSFVRTATNYKILVTDLETNIEREFINVDSTEDLYNSNDLNTLGYVATYQSAYVGYQGSIDLKQFSITVDGVPVFSGNKTNIDTIKPVNFTAVENGTDVPNPALPVNNGLVITEDGIVTNSTNNYVKLPVIPFSSANTWEIRFKFLTASTSGFEYCVFGKEGRLRVNVQSNRGINFLMAGSSLNWGGHGGGEQVKLNTLYYGKAYFNGTAYKVDLSEDNKNWTNYVNYANTNKIYDTDFAIGYNLNGASSTLQISPNPIDLNSFKVYVDGNLVYQPCLKIPYAESKTGSKVVDSIYRDRVNDMYEQFGYAPYYTLGDNDFTLPMGEIYGMIENLRKLIIERTSS